MPVTRGDGRIFTRARSPYLWISYCRNGKEIRESTQLTDNEKNRKKAAAVLSRRRGEIMSERYGGPTFVGPEQRRITVNQLLDVLAEDYKARDKSTAQFLSHLKRIRDAFGSWRAVLTQSTGISTNAKRQAWHHRPS